MRAATRSRSGPAPLESHASVWPAVAALGVFLLATGLVAFLAFPGPGGGVLGVGALVTLTGSITWWRQLLAHAPGTEIGPAEAVAGQDLRLGMGLFIASEVAFFAAFFIGYYFLRGISTAWPPPGTPPLGSLRLPTLNTALLVLSGLTLTAGHAALKRGRPRGLVLGLLASIGLGLAFLGGQAWEWAHAELAIRSGTLGSAFYLLTGFHGMHVIVGVLFLAVTAWRAWRGDFSPASHAALTVAGWYWHFVDVVWLLLFISLYLL